MEYVDCTFCDRTGTDPQDDNELCPICNGEGAVAATHGVEEYSSYGICEHCLRKGPVIETMTFYVLGNGVTKNKLSSCLCIDCYRG